MKSIKAKRILSLVTTKEYYIMTQPASFSKSFRTGGDVITGWALNYIADGEVVRV